MAAHKQVALGKELNSSGGEWGQVGIHGYLCLATSNHPDLWGSGPLPHFQHPNLTEFSSAKSDLESDDRGRFWDGSSFAK